MTEDDRLDDLIERYQEMLDEGQNPDICALCRDCPELLPEFQRRLCQLNRIGNVLDPDRKLPKEEQISLSLSDDKTWVARSEPDIPSQVEIPAPRGYEILCPLGEGGMGIVYKARQIGLDRLVALKMILSGTHARAVELARFLDEAQTIASLRHPNIVQVFEIGEYRNQPFFSLEYCPGSTLAKALKGEPQSPATAAAMTEVLSRAMDYAHLRGIVHRDLKPANVLLSSELGSGIAEPPTLTHGSPEERDSKIAVPSSSFKITDFGLAKRVNDDSRRTLDGSVMGTPSYMAPEQAFGRNDEISPATDIHALGAMLYEFLTGRPPFKGSTVHDTLEQVRHRYPVSVRELQPKVPRDLETICLTCLQKDQRKRYKSAIELADDLQRFRSGKPIKARPISQFERTLRWCRREPGTAAMAGVIALFLITIPALFAWSAARLSSAEELVEQHRKAYQAATREQNAARASEQTLRYHASANEIRQLRTDNRRGWTWEARDHIRLAASTPYPATDLASLRSEWVATLATVDLRPVGTYAKGIQPGAVSFDSDGRLAIAPLLIQPAVSTRAITLVDPKTGKVQRLPFSVPFTRNSKYFVDRTQDLKFSPDGKWLFLGLRSGTGICWDLSTPYPKRHSWVAHDSSVVGLCVSDDSQWLYTASKSGQVRRWPVGKASKPDRVWSYTKGSGHELASMTFWDGDQRGLLVHGTAGTVLIDANTFTEVSPSSSSVNEWVPPSIPASWNGRVLTHSPSGGLIVAKGTQLENWYWHRSVLHKLSPFCDTSLEDERMAHSSSIETVALHPHGNIMASASATESLVKLWNLANGKLIRAIPVLDTHSVAFDQSGTLLAVGGEHKTTLYELSGFHVHTTVARRGFPIRAMGQTHEGRLTTIAGRLHPEDRDRGSTIISVWDSNHRLLETILHREQGSFGERERIASHAGQATTLWLTGDKVVHKQTELGMLAPPGKPVAIRDLTIDDNGQCWSIENDSDLVVRPLDGNGKRRKMSLRATGGGRIGLACVRARGQFVAVGCENGKLHILGLNGKKLHECECFDSEKLPLFVERSNTVHTIDICADGTMAAAGTEDGSLWIHDPSNGNRIANWTAHDDRVTAVAFDPTGTWLVSGCRDGQLRLWKRSTTVYELYATLEAHNQSSILQVAFGIDGKQIRVLREKESAIRVWHLDRLEASFKEAGLDR